MPEAFRSLAAMLLGAGESTSVVPLKPTTAGDEAPGSPTVAGSPSSPHRTDPRVLDLFERFLVELTRLSARAAERLEERAEALLADLARHVLGRELRSAPADVEALLAQTMSELAGTAPLVVRVSAVDAERLVSTWPVRIDETLGAGDFAVDAGDGSYDVKFETRLQAMLASHRIAL